ncbi:type IV pilus assembly protein PilV [Xanthomonas arboricola]|uniref:type IV pilus modification protein PilV n=1 Tax=Xanthomonas euroxanthea TaxID=2259622 RepID=UPI0014321D84|nr:type IV pilus modification protein PilV [Xanthomonas euroxanthea]NJC38242.1 type IV pilus assembly protein PilV [Xanthomonas euroxanthea]
MKKRFQNFSVRQSSGFSLIEVLIAVLILGFGLLGFALLQTMSVRFVQSANYRTQATNLSYELLDQIRINRVAAPIYAGTYTATTDKCAPPTGAGITKDNFMLAWRCRLGKALGDTASASVARNGGVITVTVSWGDERWNPASATTSFTASTRL